MDVKHVAGHLHRHQDHHVAADFHGSQLDQPDAREGQAGRRGVAERFVVPLKPGNAAGGKGPQFKTDARRSEGRWRLGNLSTPKSVQKLQMALHAKAKA